VELREGKKVVDSWKKTLEIGVDEHEPRTEKRVVAKSPSALRASESGGQKPDVR
jgi:hypothetical protein